MTAPLEPMPLPEPAEVRREQGCIGCQCGSGNVCAPVQWFTADQMRAYALMAREAVEVPQWQPIETAPKDGLPILLATDKGVIVMGKRNKHLHIWVEMDGRETPRTISHWMPIPASPTKGQL